MNIKEKEFKGSSTNKNDINVNNNINLTINFGDSLNLIILTAGLFMIKKISKQYKINKKLLKEENEKNKYQ